MRTTRREDLTTMVFGLWTLVGLLVDAYFHSTDPGLESFWTPWHALFYSGFVSTAAWLVFLSFRRSQAEGNVLTWAPIGYRPALYGIIIFGIGGVGDAIWHTIYGVETSIDALLSPTHLLLFVGLLLILSAPVRAAWSDAAHRPSLREFGPALTSLTFTTTVVAFFFVYVWVPVNPWMLRVPFIAGAGESERVASLAVSGAIISSLILFTPLLVAGRRWKLPFGTATILLTFVNVAMAVGFDEDGVAIPAFVAGGLLYDIAVSAGWPRRVLASIPTATTWLVYVLIVGQVDGGLTTAPEIWGGAVLFAVFATTTVDLVMDLAARGSSPAQTTVTTTDLPT